MGTCKNCLHYDICTFHITGNENEKCPHYTPTADVVPKSEVEILQAEINAYSIAKKYDAEHFMADIKTLQMENATLVKNRDKLLQSYVREIFEEIERFLYMNFRFCKEEIGNDDTEYVKGRLELNTQIQDFIAELKKKYTENENG